MFELTNTKISKIDRAEQIHEEKLFGALSIPQKSNYLEKINLELIDFEALKCIYKIN